VHHAKKIKDMCSLDVDSYMSETGECKEGEEMFELYCGQVHCIDNPECTYANFYIDGLYKCEECVEDGQMWKGKALKKKADSAEHCHQKCTENKGFSDGKTCKAWSYVEGTSKPCRLFAKNKKIKSKRSAISGKRNCHPTYGKIPK